MLHLVCAILQMNISIRYQSLSDGGFHSGAVTRQMQDNMTVEDFCPLESYLLQWGGGRGGILLLGCFMQRDFDVGILKENICTQNGLLLQTDGIGIQVYGPHSSCYAY